MAEAAPILTLRIVYWGPHRAGARSNLAALRRLVARAALADDAGVTGERRTDFLSIDLGELSGWMVRLHLHAAPGAPFHEASRRGRLDGADGVVFVVDPQRRRVDDNLGALRELLEAIDGLGRDPRAMPLVLQLGKQDLPSALRADRAAWTAWLDPWEAPVVAADPASGIGVLETLRAVVGLALARRECSMVAAEAAGGAHG